MGNIINLLVFSVVIALPLGLSKQVSALEVRKVRLSDGVIQIRGKNAKPFANISWEGKSVTIAKKKGRFVSRPRCSLPRCQAIVLATVLAQELSVTV